MNPNHDEAYQYSRILRWMLKGSSREAWGRSIAVFGTLYLAMCFANYLAGSLIIPGPDAGFLEDFPNYLYFLVFMITPIFYRKVVETYLETFHRRSFQDVAPGSPVSNGLFQSIRFDDEYKAEYDQIVTTWWNRITLREPTYRFWYRISQTVLISLILLFTGILPVINGTDVGSWNFSIHAHTLGFVSNNLKEILKLGFVLPPIIYGVVMITIATTKICGNIAGRKRFHLHPLSPDKCGGLSALGRLSLRLFYIVIIQLLYLFAITLFLHMPPSHMLIYPPYIALTIFVFFYPMMSVRGSMKEAKEEELNRLSQLFTRVYDRFQAESEGTLVEEKARKDREDLIAIKEIYRGVDSMPIWPYNVETLARFSSVVLIPVCVFVFQLITNASTIRDSLEVVRKIVAQVIG